MIKTLATWIVSGLAVGCIIAYMLWYSAGTDRLVDAYEAEGAWTLPVKSEGWQQQRDKDGNIIYVQGRVEARVK